MEQNNGLLDPLEGVLRQFGHIEAACADSDLSAK